MSRVLSSMSERSSTVCGSGGLGAGGSSREQPPSASPAAAAPSSARLVTRGRSNCSTAQNRRGPRALIHRRATAWVTRSRAAPCPCRSIDRLLAHRAGHTSEKEGGMGSDARRGRLVELLGPVVEAKGLDLEDVTITSAGRRRIVRVVVDRDGGVTVDEIADVSRSVSDRLDEVDVLGDAPYVLEVTSPGVDRPLTEQRHWRRARGLLVKAVLRDGGTVEGRITDVTETEVELDGTRRIPLADLVKGRVQLEFGRPRDAGT